ncbi:hypothetical protein JCM10212_001159 [Sporobolomyces blumeae]
MDPVEAQAVLESGPLLPLLPPKPITRRLPRLPPRTSPPPRFGPGWTLHSFVVPAAFPRAYPNGTKRPDEVIEDPTDANGGKVDRKAAWNALIRAQVEAFNRPVSLDDEVELERQQQLVIAVNCYRPPRADKRRGLTLVFSHANGFYKEVWEPMLETLVAELEASDCLPVEEILALDCVVQGDSAVLNNDVLGSSFNWSDHGRDILNFVISYIDAEASSGLDAVAEPPEGVDRTRLELDNVSTIDPGASNPLERRYRGRLIVGIGHSLGGGGTAFAASACPSLFSSVVFVDPVLVSPSMGGKSTEPLAAGALVRKQRWTSRQEALEGFKKKSFFQAWDPRVLKEYVEFGLKETQDGVALKTTAWAEAMTFADAAVVASQRAFLRLASLPRSLPVHFVVADENRSVLPQWNIDELLERQVKHATSSRVEGAGHLVVHEQPQRTAKCIGDFLKATYSVRKARL